MGPALKWFTSLDMATVKTWDDLSQAFLEQYSFNIDLIPKREDLVAIRQMPHELFGKYVGCWCTLASQVKDRPSDEESIEIIIKGAQPATEALLCMQPISSFASLIQADTRVESSLQDGNFPALSTFAKQATASNSNNNYGNSSSDVSYYKKPFVTYIDSLIEPALTESQPCPAQLASAPSMPHTTQTTATIEPVHHVAPTRQGQQPK